MKMSLAYKPFAPAGLRPQDVFATSLYTGNGASGQNIAGLNMTVDGGLVWIKGRNIAGEHALYDTLRGARNAISSNATDATRTASSGNELYQFTSTGFSLGDDTNINVNSTGYNFTSWSFRRAAKFFDVVTYTGNGVAGRTIAHALGGAPGLIIIKKTSGTGNWRVYHRSVGALQNGLLNGTFAFAATTVVWNDTEPTSSAFTIGNTGDVNENGATYVAYLIAHDPDPSGIVQCGTCAASGVETVLGWRPQFLLLKRSDGMGDWYMFDTAHDAAKGATFARWWLLANSTAVENDFGATYIATSGTGFTNNLGLLPGTIQYMAIREPV